MSAAQFSLAGRAALVTGAGRGIGRAIAEALSAAGARVFVNDVDADAAHAAAGTLAGAEALPFDVADETAAAEGVAAAERLSGGLDILVNNAGINLRRPLVAFEPASFRQILEINLVAAFSLARLAAGPMAERGRGRIINIASITETIARPTIPAYIASKGGLTALTRALAVELGPKGLTCNCVAPGYVESEATAELAATPDLIRYISERTPLRRWGRPADIAPAVVFLASDAASFITGVTLRVDGGLTVAV